MTPLLTVVVAVHDVGPWVVECLESVAAHTPPGTEVIVIDDGSTDGSGDLCAQVAEGKPGWRVIHQANRGLGAARNVGLEQASGDYVGFVDGDDMLLPGYRLLADKARRTGAAVVTGAVLRTDGKRWWPSGLHERALSGLADEADLSKDHSLIFDTTAWNKLYRRDLLARHDLRFPEGVLYEDLPLTIPALYFSGTIGIVRDPVYAWRARNEGLSITQRRYELENLQDRVAAVVAVDRFLEEHELHELRLAHDTKILRLDLPLYTAALPEADVEYRTAYLAFARLILDATRDQLSGLPPTPRLYMELAAAGRIEDLVRAVRGRRGPVAWTHESRSPWARVRADWSVYRLERELGLATRGQVTRRGCVRTVKLLLPYTARRDLEALLRRLRRSRPAPGLPGGSRMA